MGSCNYSRSVEKSIMFMGRVAGLERFSEMFQGNN